MKAKKKSKKGAKSAGPKIVPVGDRVLVKIAAEAETTTTAGIIIPIANEKKSGRGTVVAVGEGRITDEGKRIPMHVKVGDKIIFSEYAGERVEIEGQEYYIVSEGSIQAIIG